MAQVIDSQFILTGINLIRDDRNTTYKTDMKEFMRKVRDTDYVLMMIGDQFLKSENCMYEVMELISDHNYREKLLQVILDDAKVFDVSYRTGIIQYWKEKKNQLETELNRVGVGYVGKEAETLKHYQNICLHISDFLNTLKSEKSLKYSDLVKDDFEQILDYIGIENDKQRTSVKEFFGFESPKLIGAVTLMESNIENPLNKVELAKTVKLSLRQLERLFQRYLQCSSNRYYQELRLKRARELLLSSSSSIEDVGVACGFVSAVHFSKCYRDMFGIAPRDERRLKPQAAK